MRRFDWTRIVALWQVVGSLVSVVFFVDRLPHIGLPAPTWQPILAVLLFLCALSALAGRALYQGRPVARTVSLIAWALQVPSLRYGPYMYGLTLGPYVYAGIFPAGTASISAAFAPHVAIVWQAPTPVPTTGGVNLLALFAMGVIWRATRTVGSTTIALAA